MPWEEFDRLMARHYAARGYRVEHTGTGARASWRKFDGGIDLKLYRDGEYIVVQCKRENVYEVTHNVVHQLIGVMHTQHATRAIVVITGVFSAAAITAAAEFPQIELIDGVGLRRMLAETGDLPTSQWGEDPLSSLAGNKSPKPSWTRRDRRGAFLLIQAGLTIGVLLFGYYLVIPAIFKNMTTSLVHASRHASVPQPTPAAQPSMPRTPALTGNVSDNVLADPTPPPPPAAISKLSKKEAQEWERKNAESMRILEKTTAPLDQ
jgi:hypothetical protein